ncbi:MAG TPA: hypothetical protein GXZ43_00995 [Clostridiaceae bacterium]|nr:hypothetical protein [Clostridiaceae bacterium]
MQYQSTILASREYTFSQMLRESVPMCGGLFVPCELPRIDQAFLAKLKPLSVQDRAAVIVKLFAPELSESQINLICQTAFDPMRFQSDLIYEIKPLNPYLMNPLFLFVEHGPTSCYTDITHAFSLACLQTVIKEDEKWYIVAGESIQSIKSLVALNSGDSGWEPVLIADSKAVNNYILREIQHIQNNVNENVDRLMLYTINGKVQSVEYFPQNLFYQEKLRLELKEQNKYLAAVGSLAFTHYLALLIILLSAYLDLLNKELISDGEDFDLAFPNLNLDFLYVGQLMQKMGLPVSNLIAASNNNRTMVDFLHKGKNKAKRKFSRTNTPALDRIYFLNLERVLFEITDYDCQMTCQIMNDLFRAERINLTPEIKQRISGLVYSGYANNNQTVEQIRDWYIKTDYLFDPYTALTLFVLERFEQNISKANKTILPVIESPLLSAQVSAEAIFAQENIVKRNYNRLLEELSQESGVAIPLAALSAEQKPEVVNLDIDKMNERIQADLFKTGFN